MPRTTNAYALSGTLALAILFGGCANQAKMAEYSLYVSDSHMGEPVQATAIVLRAAPRHPLNLNDLAAKPPCNSGLRSTQRLNSSTSITPSRPTPSTMSGGGRTCHAPST